MAEQCTSHEAKEDVKVLVVVESDGIVNEWTEMVEKKNAFARNSIVLGSGRADNLTGMA